MQFPIDTRRRILPVSDFGRAPEVPFATWLQRRMPTPLSTGTPPREPCDPLETERLMGNEAVQYMRYQRRWNACIFISMLCTAVFASLAFAGLGFTLLRVNMGMTSIFH